MKIISILKKKIYPSLEDVIKSFEGPLAGTSLPYSNTVASKQPYLKDFF